MDGQLYYRCKISSIQKEREPMRKNTYSLRLYDEELLQFQTTVRPSGVTAEITFVQENTRHLLPLDLECTGEGILQWLDRRVIPRGRNYADEICRAVGCNPNDTMGVIEVSKGLSLNDAYWIVPADFPGTFAEYNLFDNPFCPEITRIALTGVGPRPVTFPLSPEFTTNGMLQKAWIRTEEGGIYLYKAGTSGVSNAGREPYCEYYAAQIAETMGLHAVPYNLTEYRGITVSTCPLFTDQDTAFIPIGRLIRDVDLSKCLTFYNSLGPVFSEEIRSMLIFDALTYNEDRHFGNFGVLRDNRTGRITAPAPVFDSGLSLLCYASVEAVGDYEKLREYAAGRTNPYGMSFEAVCAAVMGETQRQQLERMAGFQFRRHPSINFPEVHLQALEQLLQVRAEELLSIPV